MPSERLSTLPTWLLGEATRRGWRLLTEHIATEDLSRHHYTVLGCLADQDGLAQADISRRTGLDESVIVGLLNTSAERDLVRRTRDPQNRRRNLVTLTPAGRALLTRLDEVVQQANDALLAPLSKDERDQFVALLNRVVNIDQPPETCTDR